LPDPTGLLVWPTFRSTKVDLLHLLFGLPATPECSQKIIIFGRIVLTNQFADLHDDPLSLIGKIVHLQPF
jgi:hypothetical protein